MSLYDEPKRRSVYGKAAEILNRENISNSFDVNVIVDEVTYQNRKLRSIIPVSLAE